MLESGKTVSLLLKLDVADQQIERMSIMSIWVLV